MDNDRSLDATGSASRGKPLPGQGTLHVGRADTGWRALSEHDPQAILQAVELLEASGLYQLLRKLEPRDVYSPDDGSDKLVLMFLDTEATGLDVANDKIFELSYMLVEFSPDTGRLYRVLERAEEFEDPGVELSQEIVDLTGRTNEFLKGKVFDRARIHAAIATADYVMAHNASYDRNISEREFPSLTVKNWLCSQSQGPWKAMGFGSSKLDYLAMTVGRVFYDAHKAINDVGAMVHLMTCAAHDGQPVLKHILDRGLNPSYTVWATNSPFDKKDHLKRSGYRWSDGTEADKPKAWHKTHVVDLDAELDYLAGEIYPRPTQLTVDVVSPMEAFTARYARRQTVDVGIRKQSMRP